MPLTIVLVLLVLSLSLCLMISSARNAPVGYEDECGFHLGDRNGTRTRLGSVESKHAETVPVLVKIAVR
jgi:hypothetical protein